MFKRISLVLAIVAAAAMASAQGDFLRRPSPFAGRTMLTLSLFDEVRPELKTTADENTKIDALAEKMSAEMQDAFQSGNGDFDAIRASIDKLNIKYDDQVVAILTPDQVTRLKQLFVQFNGATALTNTTIQKDLEITDDQKLKIKAAQDENSKAMREAFSSGQPDPNTFTKLQADLKAALDKILTDDQRTKFKTMEGTKFEFKKVGG